MDLLDFQDFVRSNMDLLGGVHPESEADFSGYEASMGFPPPRSMKWL